ncbi:putative zinc ribbon protein [Edwardsiella tarda]|uniref:DNA-directed RNA polymerase, beta subunit/140 kD subunit n=1 Tax=Edwardsiella tarda TaxID=636 RepID=A0A2A7U6J9_EDWTA|nr:putative zinc ribbon protein [Edwardsiella tarda]PEH73919.1 hypothetical protein CRM76_19315 [Edwardsiella tarda]
MYAKSFLAFDGNGRLTGARTAQTAPYDRYTCHLCGSALRYHPQYDTERPWFEHTDEGLAEHGHECPYVRPERREMLLIKHLQQWVPDALPVVRKASWHCRQCHHDYYGEQYCTHCHTGRFSEEAVAG